VTGAAGFIGSAIRNRPVRSTLAWM